MPLPIVVGTWDARDQSLTSTPCRVCGKSPHVDYGEFCMDCADDHGISEMFPALEREANWERLRHGPLTTEEKDANIRRLRELMRQRAEESDQRGA